MNPIVSIIIPTYNRPVWLMSAVKSALNQTYSPVEIIVVDDGSSTDEARNLVSKFTGVRYIYQRNQGLGIARNTGLAVSSGDFIQFLDDDDWLSPESISKKIQPLLADPTLGATYSNLYLTDKGGDLKGVYYSNPTQPCGNIYSTLIHRNFIPIHALMWRKTVLEKVGGFPSRSGMEDWECLIKVAEIAHFEYIDLPLGYYRIHRTSMSFQRKIQIKGLGETCQYIVSSPQFQSLPSSIKSWLLVKYGLRQWLDGDQEIAKKFIKQAADISPQSPNLFLARLLMMGGRPFVRLVFNLWSWSRTSLPFHNSGGKPFIN
jgi:glycosyltransferase involved in cell wall biosynthesis